MAYDMAKYGRPTKGEIRTVYLYDGTAARMKWTGIQFSRSPEGKREIHPVYGGVWGSLAEVIQWHREEAARYQSRADRHNAYADRIAAQLADEVLAEVGKP